MKTYRYLLQAEHISRKKSLALAKKLTDAGITVTVADMHPVLSDMIMFVLSCTDTDAQKARNMVWEENNGLYCIVDKLTH